MQLNGFQPCAFNRSTLNFTHTKKNRGMLFIYIENDAFSKFELMYSGLKQFDIIKGYYRDKEFSESVKFLVFHD